jgi:hypothetical protein
MTLCSPQGGRRLAAPSLIVTAAVALAAAFAPSASAVSARAAAAGAYHRADTAVISAAEKVVTCERAKGTRSTACSARRGRLQAAGVTLSRVQRSVARNARASSSSSRQKAPTLTISGTTLKWTKVADVTSYVLVAKVAGHTDRYSVVVGTTTTPAAQAGKTVTYAVRTAIVGSAWSREGRIAYPTASASAPPATTNPVAAPKPATGGTSTTPPPATGTGSTPTSSPSPAPAGGTTSSANFRVGVVSGAAVNWELPFVKSLGATSARMEFDIDTPAANLAPYVDAYAQAGIQPLLLASFQGRTPTGAEGRNLATWAAAYGPGGTFWAGKSYKSSTAVTRIEFGNESNQSWQYPQLQNDPDWANTPFYASVAQGYATAFKAAHEAIKGTNGDVGLLAIGDTPGNWASWMNNVYAAVPEFSSYVAGWVIHPYGPAARWQRTMDDALAQVTSHGAPSTIPIYVTEYGIASDNGRCLDDNYGWDKCMTYDQAGAALSSTVAAMRARYGSRLAAMYLYQAHDQKHPGSSGSRESYFGGLTLDGTAKGTYTAAMKTLLSAGA